MPPHLSLPSLAVPMLFCAWAAAAPDDAPKAKTVEQIAEAAHPSSAVLEVNTRFDAP